ncbi:oocyte zinc finger protein XlCOF6-like [Macrosteles quadrilineatus]|uniref:oocyte zinc finger protein XlCOF6-like n=1 Tax=Macrosteles quadrilineatus TaxID=74068 RepID=UPI0023E114C9|nr:oocyte zinc finger protein XlCOF6-like [Macrosteles quadrilineatus]
MSGYSIFRNDRLNKTGGGVAVYVKDGLNARLLYASPGEYSAKPEFMFLEICLSGSDALLMGACYRPPGVGHLADFEDILLRLMPGYGRILIMGDFNCDLLKPERYDCRQLKNMFDSCNFTILPLDPTHHTAEAETLLDLIIVNDPETSVHHGQLPVPAISRHDLIYCALSIRAPKPEQKIITSVLQHAKFHSYADDLQIYAHFKVSVVNETITSMNDDINRIVEWAAKNGLKLNPDKTKPIIIGHARQLNRLDQNLLPHITVNVTACRLWNSLPFTIRSIESRSRLTAALKAYYLDRMTVAWWDGDIPNIVKFEPQDEDPTLQVEELQGVSLRILQTQEETQDTREDPITTVSTETFVCSHCHKTYHSKSTLSVHIRRVHLPDSCYKCPECDKIFTSQVGLKIHQNTHSDDKPTMCKECGKTFSCVYNMRVHQRAHIGLKPFLCADCNTSFYDKGSLRKHQRVHLNVKPFKCSYCQRSFRRNSSLRKHEITHIGNRLFQCNTCNKWYSTKESLKRHQIVHTGVKAFTCHVCGKSVCNQYTLKIHMRIHTGDKPYACDLCKLRFYDSSTLRKHTKNYHIQEKSFQCDLCKKTFADKRNIQLHMVTHLQVKKYECKFCDKSFTGKNYLKTHINIHNGIYEFVCVVCSKVCVSKENLQAHLKCHEEEKQFSCEVCKKFFRDLGSLKKHFRTHTGERPYTCQPCGKSWRKSSSLKQHMMKHRGEQEKKVSCPVCHKRFTSTRLKVHSIIHSDVKPFPCSHCPKAFHTKSNRDVHERIHTGEKPFCCPKCFKRFAQSGNLKYHSRKCQ